MKNGFYIVAMVFISLVFGCHSSKTTADTSQSNKATNDTVRIANDDIGYEITIIDGGFKYWLNSTAKPRGFYSQSHLENRNVPWVVEYNNRARSPKSSRDAELFPMQINYENGTDYGYEVNYLLYNYLVYFQINNNIRLGGFAPRP